MTASDAQITGKYEARQIHIIFSGLILLMLLGTIDQAIVAPALTPIGADFGSMDGVSWIITGYLLTSTASIPIAGRLSDIYGRRTIVVISLAIFLFGSIVCALAPSLMVLVAGRGIQGLGGGALMALPNSIVADILSPRERGKYQVYITGTYAVSSLAGPILGSYLSGVYSWQWIFWINIPLCVLALTLSWYTLSDLDARRRDIKVDVVGSFLLTLCTISLLLALTWGGTLFDWTSIEEVTLFVGFLLILFVIIYRQMTVAQPLIPVSIITNRVISVTSLGALLITSVNTPLSIFVPLYLQWERGLSVEDAGYVLVAPLFGVVLGSYLSGQYMRFTGRYKLSPIVGIALSVLGFTFCFCFANSVGLILFSFVLFIIGLGVGGSFPPMMVSSQNSVSAVDIGIATAVHTYFRAVGGAIGVVLFSTITLNQLITIDDVTLNSRGTALIPQTDPALVIHAFNLFFVISALILTAAWLVLLKLPTIPFRTGAAKLETTIIIAGQE